MLDNLKEDVLQANRALVSYGLVTLTWGNVSGIDRGKELIVIKPSGIDYAAMTVRDMVVVDMAGVVVEGERAPSSDTPTHLELYKAFSGIGGIAHSHSEYATVYAQACREIPCIGTTHADHFNGPVPVTRFLTKEEVNTAYERHTGTVIIERFRGIDPSVIPGVLVAGHAPFTWGKNPADSVRNNLILERIAKMAFLSFRINPDLEELPDYILNKHYQRKHGPDAYYGQPKNRRT
jgi:L-ribulose-5-phosphate 4-epimerase